MINTEAIIRKMKIRAFASENKNYGETNKDNNMHCETDIQARINQIEMDLNILQRVVQVPDEIPITSHRKGIGKFIVFGKKFIRKFLRWYIQPIAKNQTIYNHTNLVATTRLNESIGAIEQELKNLRLEMNEINHNNNQEFLKVIKMEREEIEQLIHIQKCEYEKVLTKQREELQAKTFDIVEHQIKEIYRRIKEEEIYKTQDIEEKVRCYADLLKMFNEEKYINKIQELYNEKNSRNIKIAVLCKTFKEQGPIEAIKKEAYKLYQELNNKDNIEVYFISIEENQNLVEHIGNEVFVSPKDLSDCLDQLKVDIVHVFESNAHILFDDRMHLLKYNVVFTMSGQSPLVEFNEYGIEELQHFSDNNHLCILTQSQKATDELYEHGIRNVHKTLPIVEKPSIKQKNSNDEVVIGFASTPMEKEQLQDRGIYFLEELIKDNKGVTFKIAWRNRKVEVPKKILDSSNVQIEYGFIDMNKFYSEVDAVIIPYTSDNNNHACSLSGIEAISVGIPVITTRCAGIAEIISEIDSKCIGDTNTESMNGVIRYLVDSKSDIQDKFKRYQLFEETEASVEKILNIYGRMISEKVPSLHQWRSKLQGNEKYLVKGTYNIKEYYENQKIAVDYDKDRFIQYPMSLVNELERIAVNQIVLENGKEKNEEIQLLDIATGTGRILEKLLDKGTCTALDNSSEMLNIILDKFGDAKHLNLIKGDFFEMSLDKKFDIITTFRYIRHFANDERKKIMSKIVSILNKDGLLIFDVPNLKAEIALRNSIGWEHFNIYDVFWTKESITLELREYGFEIEYMIPIDGYYFDQLPEMYRNEPISWTVAARYKGVTI